MTLTGAAKVAGVVGWPIAHSRSPRLHGFWIDRHDLDAAYVPLAVAPERAEAALRALPALGFAGVNVTVPHKETALRVADEVDEAARLIGAVNTLVVRDGRLIGRNTDGIGFITHLQASTPQLVLGGARVTVLGAGGASRAVIHALLAAGVAELRLLNRTRARAEELARLFGPRVCVIDWAERAAALEGAGLLVNTTVLGMHGQAPLDLRLDALPGDAVVYDLVYVPLETPLLAAARARGLHTVDGLGMLLHQGRPGFAAWFGVDPLVDDELRRFVAGDLLLGGGEER